jgi:predicted DNA-binding ArsR family transcriptional regulator
MSEKCIYQINCNQCNFTKKSNYPFFSDLKENNKRYMLYEKAKENIIWITYYDLIVPESNKINELFLSDNSLKEYAKEIKKLMETFLK